MTLDCAQATQYSGGDQTSVVRMQAKCLTIYVIYLSIPFYVKLLENLSVTWRHRGLENKTLKTCKVNISIETFLTKWLVRGILGTREKVMVQYYQQTFLT